MWGVYVRVYEDETEKWGGLDPIAAAIYIAQ